MATPTETVTAFLDLWDKPGGLDQSIRDYFTPATVWENVGLAVTTGVDEAIALNAGFAEKFGMDTMRVDMLSIAESGSKVLTERMDHFLDASGKLIASFPVMGIFELEDGKITAWRDYFDSAAAQQAG
jgi:limonene-1,2-epoxide hydrolase